ncbi:hypothetical protein EOD41_02925 [Mucilaginibacter limnophilus]|uniref:Glycoside hydrolase family 5 domain-containing protein n=1 Tax=Mucilaginibacter limnophilus TaxID=1932778 RepID=A0A3S2VQA3_9SPHI|nr:cellulase family glycosylhydrolase [Mucilaginibacter limnophilus]RVU02908.1 hypothetical protein EOD41_02925 [Mucilaginibacter limnophilus]
MKKLRNGAMLCAAIIAFAIMGCKRTEVSPTNNKADHLPKPAKKTMSTKNATGGMCPSLISYMTDAQITQFMNDFDATNALYIRMDLPWSVIQPTSTTWNFTQFDKVIDAAIAKGFKVLVIPTYCPSWANGGNADDKYPPTAAHATSWYNFVKACADRYIPKGVDAWEMWNEPNITAFWKPTCNVANYTNIVLKNGANAVRASATALGKSVTIVSAGLSPAVTNGADISPTDFLTGIYANSGKNYMDAIGIHPYCFPDGPYSTSIYSTFNKVPDLYQIMTNNGDGAKKIWGTEVGWHTGNSNIGGVTQAQQAQFVTDAYTRWRSWSYTGPLFWYAYKDLGTNPADREQNFGLKLSNGTNKPGWQNFVNAMNTSATTYYRIQNRWQPTQYLLDGGTRVTYGSGTGDAYLWSLETYSGFTRIKNKATGEYMHAENGPTNLNCTTIQADALSSHFTLTTISTVWKSIKCRWTNNFVNNEGQLGYAECDMSTTPSDSAWYSEQWNFIQQ